MRLTRWLRAALAGGLLFAMIASARAAGLEIGTTSPDFAMTTIAGRRFSLAETEKSHAATVVLFISTICPYSNRFNDLMRDMASELGKKRVAFVGINSGTLETEEEVRAHARDHGHTFDIIKDPENRVADLLDARRTPEVFLFDSSGTLRYHGRIASKLESPDLRAAIDALLDGKPIHPAETKAFGCAIPRR
jgi:peroxiredoxin